MYFLTVRKSFIPTGSTIKFLKPLPIPKSNVKIQFKTEIIVNQTPNTSYSEKKLMYAGNDNTLIIIAKPLIPIDPIIFQKSSIFEPIILNIFLINIDI